MEENQGPISMRGYKPDDPPPDWLRYFTNARTMREIEERSHQISPTFVLGLQLWHFALLLVVTLAVVFGALYCCRRRRRQRSPPPYRTVDGAGKRTAPGVGDPGFPASAPAETGRAICILPPPPAGYMYTLQASAPGYSAQAPPPIYVPAAQPPPGYTALAPLPLLRAAQGAQPEEQPPTGDGTPKVPLM